MDIPPTEDDVTPGGRNEFGGYGRSTVGGDDGKWSLKGGQRPFGFWQWEGYGSYLEFLAGLIVVLGVLQVILGRFLW